MTAFFPLRITGDWSTASIHAAIEKLAVDLGFCPAGSTRDVFETDAQRIVDDFIRDHRITRSDAIERLAEQRSLLLEQYERTEHRWHDDAGEIVVVLANDNVIPFFEEDIQDTGNIRFACGWVEFVMPDRKLEQLRIDDRIRNLPLFWSDNRA